MGFPGGTSVKNHLQCRRCGDMGLSLGQEDPLGEASGNPLLYSCLEKSHGQIPWRRNWQPIPVTLPRKCHGQRSLAGYSPWDRKRVGHS